MLNKEIHFNETEIPNSPEYNSGYYCGYKEGLANEHQEKMVSLDEVCDMLYAMLDTHQDSYGYDYVTAPAYDTVEDLVEDFRKSMEK